MGWSHCGPSIGTCGSKQSNADEINLLVIFSLALPLLYMYPNICGLKHVLRVGTVMKQMKHFDWPKSVGRYAQEPYDHAPSGTG